MIASGSLTIPSRTTAIDDARRWSTGYLSAAGASADAVWAVELALTEALSNVIRHGYGGDETKHIDLELELHDDRVELRITDFGEPFDVRAYTEPELDASPAGGYGVHLIGELMDEVQRTDTTGRGTCLRLVKRHWKESQ